MTFKIRTRPYIVAEVGSNFETLDQALESVDRARECGADAVKFQLYTASAMFGFDGGTDAYSLPLDWLPKLAERSAAAGIDFGCTAFSPELVAKVDPYVHWHKVASSDAAWPQLLEAVRDTGKPVFLSTGAKESWEVERARDILGKGADVYILYCVAAYPADVVDLDMLAFYDGFSDHTLGYTAAIEAARQGAYVLEKHFTAFPELATPDRPHSLTPEQFGAMVHMIRAVEMPDQEEAMRLRHNRRLVATCDIRQGEALVYGDNYGAYRSRIDDTRGASPLDWQEVEGARAVTAILRGTPISLEDVE